MVRKRDIATEPQPGGRAPAPPQLRLVQAFLNTNDIEGGEDRLGTATDLRAWLAEHGLLRGRGPITEPDRRRAVEIREALRAIVIAREEGGGARDATSVLARASEDAHLTLRIDPVGWELTPAAGGVYPLVARLLTDLTAAIATGSWLRLKACRRDACRWVYWDASRSRTGTWCAMTICGNRVKGTTFRQRRRPRRRA